MAKTVNIDDLTRAAVVYNNVLRELPYFSYQEIAKKLRINVLEVDGEDVLISKRRKADILRAYKAGLTLGDEQELIKFFEAKLKPELVYAEIKDNVTNYREKKVISNAGEPLNNKTKTHPLEFLILKDMVLSFSEDVIFNMFHAQRNVNQKSAETSFNGFFYKLSLLASAGEISMGNRNLTATGSFTPSNDMSHANYTRMVDFLQSAHPLLRRGETLLYASEKVMNTVRDDFRKLVKAFDYPSVEQVVEKLRSDANIPGLQIITDESYGTGDQLILTKPGNLDFGVSKDNDKEFVQVRNPYADPNEVQFWIQAAYDTRINDVHEKLLLINEQQNQGITYAGDYKTPVAVTAIAVDSATASIKVEETHQIKVTFNPDNATNKGLIFTSADEDTATVSANGLVTGVAAGEVVITVKSEDGKKSKTVTVTVTAGS